MVVASSAGDLTFFENIDNEGVFEQIRHWKYRCEELKRSPEELKEGKVEDVIRGVQVLDNERWKMLSVQLANRNVLLIDMI